MQYQQCNRCVMDTTDPEIHFDSEGNCNHCSEYFENTSKRVYQGEGNHEILDEIVNQIKHQGKDQEYDCVLGLSGGIDSCYAAYILKNLGLRTLAVHLDNGWDSEISVTNIKYIVKKLGFGYQSYVLDWEEFKDLQLSFLKASVPEAETPTDVAIPAVLHEIAAKNNIKYIISGGNFATEGILPKSWHYNAKDEKYLKSIHKKFGKKKLKTFPTFGYQKEMYYKFVKGIKTIYLLNYVPYSKKDAMKILEEELKWKYYGGKHYESKYTGFLQSYILPKKFNIDYRLATFSTQICAGEITREEAMAELVNLPYDKTKVDEEAEYICKKLSITREEFEDIMNEPPKTSDDYPNSQKRLEFIYEVYRKIYARNIEDLQDPSGLPTTKRKKYQAKYMAELDDKKFTGLKVLILCYDFPPLPSVGAERPYSWFKHFNKFGIYPIIITRKWKKGIKSHLEYFEKDSSQVEIEKFENATIIRVPKRQSLNEKMIIKFGIDQLSIFRKGLTFLEIIFKWLTVWGDDKSFLYLYTRSFLTYNKTDALLVTGEPFVLFKHGSSLSEEFNIPWIADYRDGWTTNYARNLKPVFDKALLKYERHFEKKYLSNVLFYSAVSDSMVQEIGSISPDTKGFESPNGVELSNFKRNEEDPERTKDFIITYAGRLHEIHRVDIFIKGVKLFIEKNKPTNLKVRLIGIQLRTTSHEQKFVELQKQFNSIVEILMPVPPDEVTHFLMESTLLLKFDVGPQSKGLYGAKLYGYAAAKKPILTIPSQDISTSMFFPKNNIQEFALNKDDVCRVLEKYHTMFLNGERIETSLTDDDLYSISREYQAKQFAEHIKETLSAV